MLRSRVLPLLGLAAFISTASGCGCGRGPGLMKTESSLSLPQEVLDFGPVVEGTSKQAKFTIENTGRSSVGVSAALKEGSSGEFELGPVTPTVDALGFIEVAVTFTPAGPGEDEGFVEVQSAQPDTLPLTLRLHGGPIAPGIEFDPDPVDFNPSTMLFEAKTARVKSVGTSALNVRAIGVAGNGNPDFSVVPPTTPARLLPGESLNVRVEYSRSARDAEGRMEVLSDAEDAGTAWLRLIPDPPAKCSNGIDDDMDGVADFPNDPGCQDPDDDDEYHPTVCINGAMRPCGSDAGVCVPGTQSCVNGVWAMCSGMGMSMPETCNNMDDDCDGTIDDGVDRACYTGTAGTMGIGACRGGLETCTSGVWPGTCVGQVTPIAETCNNVDEDCDGLIDNGVTRTYTGPGGTLNVGNCRGGMEACSAGAWSGTCAGQTLPQGSEICANGLDETCNGVADEGCPDAGMPCNPNGLFTIDGGTRLTYSCCDFGIGPLVDIDINQFSIQSSGTQVVPSPTQPGNTMTPMAAITCPTPGFIARRTIAGTCTETYSLTGTWTSNNTFQGTYTAVFTGSDCTGSLCAGDPCANQSWTFSAGR